MRILNRAADRLLGRFVPKARAEACACNGCVCESYGRYCCWNCNCSEVRCYGPCTP